MLKTETSKARRARYAEHQRNWRKRNPTKVNNWRKRNPDKVRSMHLKRKFKMTVEQWNELFEAQGRRCACCGTTEPGAWGRKNNWATDHDHETGEVRGIICIPCNFVLGWLGDKLETVKVRAVQLVEYLSRRPLTVSAASASVEAMSHRP